MQKLNNQSKIIYHDREINYVEIRNRIEVIKKLITSKVSQNTENVVIALRRTPDYIYSIIALLELNITYLPLELNQPEERIKYIMEDSKSRIIITTSEFRELFGDKLQIVLDQDDIPEADTFSAIQTNKLAYILYTSGSTGKPKGVKITRKGLINFMNAIPELIAFKEGKKIICLTSFGFDIYFLECILPLYLGMTIILADDRERQESSCISRLILDNSVDMLQMTPSAMNIFLKNPDSSICLKRLSEILLGGEKLSLKLVQTLQKESGSRIYNMYGPTETTIWSMVSDLTKKNKVDIGNPILNTGIYILNEKMKIVEKGEVGELYITGDGLCDGYIGRRELTEQRFLKIPTLNHKLAYRTGDLAKINEEGNIEYVGRCDNQVKFYGYRIELEEIEYYINQIPGIETSIIFIEEVSDDNKLLNALYTGNSKINEEETRRYLKSKLPAYMIPTVFHKLDMFIYNSNGKIDRQSTIESHKQRVQEGIIKRENEVITSNSEIADGVIKVIKILMSDEMSDLLLPESKISVLGIDSIKFVQMIVKLEEEFNIEIEFEKMTSSELNTVEAIIKYITLRKVGTLA